MKIYCCEMMRHVIDQGFITQEFKNDMRLRPIANLSNDRGAKVELFLVYCPFCGHEYHLDDLGLANEFI